MVELSREFIQQAHQNIREVLYEWGKVLPKSKPKQHKRKRTKWKNRSKK